jgi:3-deoxy-D-manno-octulosonate 8-phosphate phosphatase (KDO 8-P phosphatase)
MNYKSLLPQIKHFVFDYDGVMSDGTVFVMPDGEMLRASNVRDGFILKTAARLGYTISVISGGYSKGLELRLRDLGIKDVLLGVSDKVEALDTLITDYLDPHATLYMGDDLPDFRAMKKVLLPCCPADAVEEIKAISMYISSYHGGKGCVRDVIEQVLRINHQWPPQS